MASSDDQYALEFDRSVLPVLDKLSKSRVVRRSASKYADVDFVVELGDSLLFVETKSVANPASARSAAQHLKRLTKDKSTYPLLVVPYMTASTQSVCIAESISWADLSGNMHIEAGPFVAHVEGKPNRFPVVGRPGNVLSPSRARLLRILLEKREPLRIGELTAEAQQGAAQVSREVSDLVYHGILKRTLDRRVTVNDPVSAIGAWASAYNFRRHAIVEGHMPGDAIERIAQIPSKLGRKHKVAFTGLSAAQAYTNFLTNYRLVSVYVDSVPESDVFERLQFTREARGANTWLIVPADPFVFYGANEIGGTPYVSRVQAYLDLQSHPERSKEAAGEILTQLKEEWRG